jgi:hypothetical protein
MLETVLSKQHEKHPGEKEDYCAAAFEANRLQERPTEMRETEIYCSPCSGNGP